MPDTLCTGCGYPKHKVYAYVANPKFPGGLGWGYDWGCPMCPDGTPWASPLRPAACRLSGYPQ